jgi:hypothetical protein
MTTTPIQDDKYSGIPNINLKDWEPLTCSGRKKGNQAYDRKVEPGVGALPMTRLGKSNRSRRMWKQKVTGTGVPSGFSNAQWEYTDCGEFSNTCLEKFSQYSTAD